MRGLLPSLTRDERGTSVIEMAIVMPVFATLLVGAVDISRAYSQKLLLEQAAHRAIEKVQQYQANSSTYTTLKAEAALAAQEAGFTVLATDVVVDYWLECNGTRQSTYETNCSTGQTYARWITVVIPAKFTPLFSSNKWPGSNSDGTYTVRGKAGLRTQ